MAHSGDSVLILDFGSQYTQLIARRVREQGVYAEIYPCNAKIETIREYGASAIILSGGPASVYADDAPRCAPEVFEMGLPILGICYGLQMIAYDMGGEVDKSAHREYGRAQLIIDDRSCPLFTDLPEQANVWMSHGDKLTKLPTGFRVVAHSANSPICAVANDAKKIYGVQFHPEVVHTTGGSQIIANFLFDVAGLKGGWNSANFIEATIREIRDAVGSDTVICALSGGVDSAVAATLVHRAIGSQLKCIHVDNGLMRRGESAEVVHTFRDHFGIDLDFVDASELFLTRLAGVTDPEQKRKIIGKAFIDVLADEAKKFSGAKYLVQGTIYPDVIESLSFKGPSQTIKSHHNVGGLPELMELDLIEPLRELFKDEVRNVGRALGIPEQFIERHPFPGPGLAIRVIGDVSREKLDLLRAADAIFLEELHSNNLYHSAWQAFAVLLPVRTVGVMGDERTYDSVCAIRAVTSVDGMTADWARLPHEALATISSRISNEVKGISRVVYDISSKPPATIEWE
ncbi:MAG: glutamine-hydrolyzing GMP synthase [Bacteroidetes bacterium]|nr:glutamine-hydrolyzing GMP synthase [Bacteroidota bacterium]